MLDNLVASNPTLAVHKATLLADMEDLQWAMVARHRALVGTDVEASRPTSRNGSSRNLMAKTMATMAVTVAIRARSRG
jgi:hypothetical protein